MIFYDLLSKLFVHCLVAEEEVFLQKIDLLLNLINFEDSLLNNKTSNLTAVNDYNLDFDFLQVRTLIKEVETDLGIL